MEHTSVQDEALREASLVFYKEDMIRLDELIEEFLRASKAKCAFLVDRDGHLVTRKGFTQSIEPSTISALVAGSFAATREMARLLGEEQFSLMFHQGERDNIQLSIVGNRAILAVIFDERTNVGLVRIYTKEATDKLAKVFKDIEARQAAGFVSPPMEGDFGSSAGSRLDDVFGGSAEG